MKNKYDLGIIGGGPAGYSAAIRAAQKGLKVVLFEKECLGGVCLNKGCIPTKTILHCTDFYKNLKKAEKFGVSFESAQPKANYAKIFERKNEVVQKIQKSLTKLVESHGVQIIQETAKLTGTGKIEAGAEGYECKNIILATGSKPAQIKGLETDKQFVLNSNDILNLKEIPENLLIVGSGAIGVEWARIFNGLEKNVTVVELAPRLLPLADVDVSKRLDRLFKKSRIKFFTGTKVENIEGRMVTLSNGQTLKPDIVLCAVGREPVLPEFAGMALERDGKFLKVDGNFQCRVIQATNVDAEFGQPNIFAIGDVNGKMQLAHSAVHQALAVVDFIADKKPVHFDKNSVPSVIYGSPEIAWVGAREQDFAQVAPGPDFCEGDPLDLLAVANCRNILQFGNDNYSCSCKTESADYTKYKSFTFPISALGKAMADNEIDGFVKVLSVEDRIVGAHVVAPEASSLIQQFALIIDNGLKTQDVLKTVFAHPTYSEAVFESILGLDNMSLSLPPV